MFEVTYINKDDAFITITMGGYNQLGVWIRDNYSEVKIINIKDILANSNVLQLNIAC